MASWRMLTHTKWVPQNKRQFLCRPKVGLDGMKPNLVGFFISFYIADRGLRKRVAKIQSRGSPQMQEETDHVVDISIEVIYVYTDYRVVQKAVPIGCGEAFCASQREFLDWPHVSHFLLHLESPLSCHFISLGALLKETTINSCQAQKAVIHHKAGEGLRMDAAAVGSLFHLLGYKGGVLTGNFVCAGSPLGSICTWKKRVGLRYNKPQSCSYIASWLTWYWQPANMYPICVLFGGLEHVFFSHIWRE